MTREISPCQEERPGQVSVNRLIPFFFRININYCFHNLFLGSNNRNCAVPLCKSYGVIFDNKRNRNVTYHKIPSDLNVKQAWLQRIRREENSTFKVWN